MGCTSHPSSLPSFGPFQLLFVASSHFLCASSTTAPTPSVRIAKLCAVRHVLVVNGPITFVVVATRAAGVVTYYFSTTKFFESVVWSGSCDIVVFCASIGGCCESYSL